MYKKQKTTCGSGGVGKNNISAGKRRVVAEERSSYTRRPAATNNSMRTMENSGNTGTLWSF